MTDPRQLARMLAARRPALFLDYDGTLTPIVARPELAVLDAAMREALERAAAAWPVAIISGRDRADVERLINLPGLVYAGSHGLDIKGPGGLALEHPSGVAALAALDAASVQLGVRVGAIEGLLLERKRFSLAVHFRNVDAAHRDAIDAAVTGVVSACKGLRRTGGKMVYELRPAGAWDKGSAVLWLLEALRLGDRLPVYAGDDVTDEDAFRALAGRGTGIRVAPPPEQPTAAEHHLPDTAAVRRFLEELARLAIASG